jgi:hypothetical protein
MMRNVVAFVVTFAIFSGAANASRWAAVGTTGSGVQFIDLDAIIFEDGIATIWLRTELAEKGRRGESVTLEKWMHDCANGRAKVLALTMYKADGSVIGSAQLPRYELEWTPLIPNSPAYVVHEHVCRR